MGEPIADTSDQPGHPHPSRRLRILIIGAGIAGATLAALLRRRGQQARVIEKDLDAHGEAGYMLGLLPLGGRVLNGLELSGPYADRSTAMHTYELYSRQGKLIRSYPLSRLTDRFGDWRGIERGALLSLLRSAAGPIEYGTTVTSLHETPQGVTATFNDDSTSVFDLVVGADGIHSRTRAMILPSNQVGEFDTGWGGYVAWTTGEDQMSDTYSELWSSGWGVGIYPVPGRLGVFLAGRHGDLSDTKPQDYAAYLASLVPPGRFADALGSLEAADGFYWRMADARAKTWRNGRVVLLGDAAAAFLPTAGVGASAAMDSAAALDDELSRAQPDHVGYALELYERRQKRRVERMQKSSRSLARWMFVDSTSAATLRDVAARFYSLEMLMRNITKVMEGR